MIQATGGNVTLSTIKGIIYQVHTFTSSSNFVVTDDGPIEFLVVAGGGSGGVGSGSNGNAGGGAGGMITSSTPSLAIGTYPIVVGAGGANNVNGSNSSFLSNTAVGGGRGAQQTGNAALSGGSGGGAAGGGGTGQITAIGAAGTAGQGTHGGSGWLQNALDAGGGGGGALYPGQGASQNRGGDGGSGREWPIGSANYYAGGGGGASYDGITSLGGLGGGGGGGTGTLGARPEAPSGLSNTGGGGGGGNTGGTGGSGIVIIIYEIDRVLFAETVIPQIVINKFDSNVNYRPVTSTTGVEPYTYSISPALPAGLNFNTSSGQITGSPLIPTYGFNTYTVTITDAELISSSNSFSLQTTVGYLNSIDLVVNSTLSVQVVKGIAEDERLTSEIIPYNTSVLVDDLSTTKNLYFGNTATVTVNSGSSNFNYTATVSTTPVEHSFYNYISLNNQLQQSFGSATVGVTGFVVDEQEYLTPGSYTWTVPAGVTSISAVGIGGGGGGSQKITGGTGGQGGSLQYVNQIPVTPGDEYTVVIGAGGTTGSAQGNNGGTTYLMNNLTKEVVLLAPGGTGGDAMYWNIPNIFFEIIDNSQTIDLGAIDPQGRNITYSVSAGSLPAGVSLNSATGKLNYIIQNITEDITYPTFTLSAAVTGQTITRIVALRVLYVPLGSAINNPAGSATALSAAGITTNGNYFITISGQTVQCHVNFTLPGGPYILAMTTANTGSEYGYDSSVWTATTGGSLSALDPALNANQVSYAFYHLATTRTGLSLHQNVVDYMHYIDHASFTARALANGAVAVPTAATPTNTSNAAGTLITNGQTARAQGWFDAVTGAGFTAMTVGTRFYRYGWQHGIPDPATFGYVRFGWSADVDTSDSRDRAIGIGLKNNGGNPIGTYAVSSGYFDYSNNTKNNIRSWLWVKN